MVTSRGGNRALPRSRARSTAPVDVQRLSALRAARDALDRSFADPLDVSAVAQMVGYSRSHFNAAFRRTYGETPGQFLTRRRIERAASLLACSNATVTEVCLMVGFSSVGSFTTKFTALLGQSPASYRISAKQLEATSAVPACFQLMWRTSLPAADPSHAS